MVDNKRAYFVALDNSVSINAYATVVGMFIRSVLRYFDGSVRGLQYAFPITDDQKICAAVLIRQIDRNVKDKDTLNALHDLLYSIFKIRTGSTRDLPEDCLFMRYLALRALKDDGGFITAEVLTGIFAKVKYLSNCIAIMQADRIRDSFADGLVGYAVLSFLQAVFVY